MQFEACCSSNSLAEGTISSWTTRGIFLFLKR